MNSGLGFEITETASGVGEGFSRCRGCCESIQVVVLELDEGVVEGEVLFETCGQGSEDGQASDYPLIDFGDLFEKIAVGEGAVGLQVAGEVAYEGSAIFLVALDLKGDGLCLACVHEVIYYEFGSVFDEF